MIGPDVGLKSARSGDFKSRASSGSVKSLYEAMKLNDFEVFISMSKLCLGIGIFNRPYLYMQNGITNCIVGEILNVAFVLLSYRCLIDCMQFLPRRMAQPNSKLTYGKVVSYILDQRSARIGRNSNLDISRFTIRNTKSEKASA